MNAARITREGIEMQREPGRATGPEGRVDLSTAAVKSTSTAISWRSGPVRTR